MNPQAKRLRKDRRIRQTIRKDYSQFAHIIDCDEQHDVIAELSRLARYMTITTIYIVGGDGTFNNILNWIIGRPHDKRPNMVSVGGGQFCYMAKFHGFKSSNPIKNLHDVFHRKIQLIQRDWQPVCMLDSVSNTKRYAAVFANGIICDVIDWYEEKGKGGLLSVIKIVCLAILSVLSERIRQTSNRIHFLKGQIFLDKKAIQPKHYVGFTFASVPELVTFCRPFKGRKKPNQFSGIVYWGGLKRLSTAALFIWLGRMPPWIKHCMFNAPIHKGRVIVSDRRLIIDGNLELLPESGSERTLTFTADEKVSLLVVDTN